ncbi:hypothetical protein [Saccharopolyspora hattusasensis]
MDLPVSGAFGAGVVEKREVGGSTPPLATAKTSQFGPYRDR